MPEKKYTREKDPGLTNKEIWTRLNQRAEMLANGVKLTSKWTAIVTNISNEDKSNLVGNVIEITVRDIMGNHVYMFDGQGYLQTKGGAIGLRFTGLVAREVMDHWAVLMRRKMTINKMEIIMMSKYNDDVLTIVSILLMVIFLLINTAQQSITTLATSPMSLKQMAPHSVCR
jgi:hypothetical protein